MCATVARMARRTTFVTRSRPQIFSRRLVANHSLRSFHCSWPCPVATVCQNCDVALFDILCYVPLIVGLVLSILCTYTYSIASSVVYWYWYFESTLYLICTGNIHTWCFDRDKMATVLDLKDTYPGVILTPGRTDKKILKDHDPEPNNNYRSHVGTLNWLSMGVQFDVASSIRLKNSPGYSLHLQALQTKLLEDCSMWNAQVTLT